MEKSDKLLTQAEKLLKDRLLNTDDKEDIYWKLAEVLRKKGSIHEALYYYENFHQLRPENEKAGMIISILKNHSTSKIIDNMATPAPFVQINNFLSSNQQSLIWDVIKNNSNRFSPSTIGKKRRIEASTRNSHILYRSELKDIDSWFLAKIETTLANLWNRLQVPLFTPGLRELQLSLHLNGQFYKAHKDSSINGNNDQRQITFVYYFYSLPKRFKGGNLLLFDTDLAQDKLTSKYTRIEPLHNRVLFFPSDYYHQVTPVTSEYSDIESGRFTLNGWLNNPLLKR